MTPRILLLHTCILFCFVLPCPLFGQLNNQFSDVFSEILDKRLRRSATGHGVHFLESAAAATRDLTPALNSLISNNVSSFPLSSSSVAISFDFSSGVPVSTIESVGPVFSEVARTIGKGRLALALSYSYLDLSTFRGRPIEDMRFTFTHQDVTGEGTLGENTTETDYMDVVMGMKVRANIGVLFGTFGVTDNFDVGLGIPLINVSLRGNAMATIYSNTFASFGFAQHSFGSDSLRPVLETSVPYDGEATGLGNVAITLKYNFVKGGNIDVAAFADVRLPTAKEEDFHGSRKTSVRIAGIFSKRSGNFTPHVNFGYEHRAAEFQSSRLDFRVGFDQRVTSGLTFACDILGTIDLNSDKVVKLLPGSRTITYNNGNGNGSYQKVIRLSNVSERSNDNIYNLSAGIQYASSERFIVMANIIASLNDGGLRAPVIPTIGIKMNL